MLCLFSFPVKIKQEKHKTKHLKLTALQRGHYATTHMRTMYLTFSI